MLLVLAQQTWYARIFLVKFVLCPLSFLNSLCRVLVALELLTRHWGKKEHVNEGVKKVN